MVEIRVDYEGELHCRSVHGPSGADVASDAPVDNCGKGESFSPTDLVATALGTCMLTTMGIVAQRHEVDLAGAKARVEKHMTSEAPRKIARLVVDIEMPLPEDHPQRELLESTAHGCPVHRSIHADVAKDVSFRWTG